MSEPRSRHPETETMAAFVEGTLGPEELLAVTGHLRGCADCRIAVSETSRFAREEQQREDQQSDEGRREGWRSSWRWVLPVAAMFAIAVFGVLLWQQSRRDPLRPLLAAAPRDHRLIEPRLSGFTWARLQAPARGAAPHDPADLKLIGAAGEVLQRTAGVTSLDAQHARGVALLFTAQTSESLSTLEQAAARSKDARAWNDLAAARYVAATVEGRSAQLPLALAAADRALALDAKHATARFNRALILERLELRAQAREAWNDYLTLDGGSEWSAEAREHLRRLDEQAAKFESSMLLAHAESGDRAALDALVRQFAQDARAWGEGPLLAEWADAESADDHVRAAQALGRVRAIGGSIARVNGEHLLGDSIRAVDEATPDRRRLLAAGQRSYRDARLSHRNRLSVEAERQFRHAAELFRRGGSPMAQVAAYFAAVAAFDQNRGDEAARELLTLLAATGAQRHGALAAQIEWQLAVYANSVADWGAAMRRAGRAASLFRARGERKNAAWNDAIAAHALDQIGQDDAAWARRLGLMRELDGDASRDQRTTVLYDSAGAQAALGRFDEAAALLDLSVAEGRAGNPIQLARALARRARAGAATEVAAYLAEARRTASGIPDAKQRSMIDAEIDLAEGSASATADPHGALVRLDRALAFFEGRGLSASLPDVRLQRGRALRAAGNDDAAAAEYAAALRAVESEREMEKSAGNVMALDTAARIVEESIDLELVRGNAATAFAIADRSRAAVGGGASGEVPADVAVIEYAVLPRALAIFFVTGNRVFADRVAIERKEIDARVLSFAAAVRRRAPVPELKAASAALHALLIAPVLPRLAGIDEIVFVPDRLLHAVPFAALYDGPKGRYLIEDFTIRFAVSAAGAKPVIRGAVAPAVVVADPPSANWPRLGVSRREAERIAGAYGATLIGGADATRERFADAARGSALIHYAGHADSDPMEAYAALLLAETPSDPGVLSSSEIALLRLERQPLVVLAACGTFRGGALHVAGMSSIARSFLRAGARAVVGTLWEIDDDVAAALFVRFHDHHRAGASPAAALRAAQIEMLSNADPRLSAPATWAAVELLGASEGENRHG